MNPRSKKRSARSTERTPAAAAPASHAADAASATAPRDALVRFGVAMESTLLEDFDALVDARGSTRSELLRDLARAEITRARQRSDVPAVGTLTLVYDHHVRDLAEKLTEMQHDLGDQVRSTLHVHLDHAHCLEVIVLMGRARHLHEVADRLLATKGVKHGALELVPTTPEAAKATKPATPRTRAAPKGGHRHDHSK